MSLSEKLVALIAHKPITIEDRKAAALLMLDAVANIFAGLNSQAGAKLIAWARALSGGALDRLDAGRKALLLGALCHIQEMDDLHRASVVHPGCAVVPVCLSLGRGLPADQVLDALIWGFEAATRVGMAAGPAHYRIWHSTATCGPFGSAMAAARLLGLDERPAVNALGNAGSQSAGLWEFIATGAETKHLHAGRAAEAGLVAAQLAKLGFTGAPHIFEGDRGFFRATCPDADPDQLLAGAHEPWQVHATSIKPWPSCRHIHPAIEAALALHRRIGKRQLKHVRIATYPAAIALCDRAEPDSAHAAKFSLQHCVAAALSDGVVDLASFEQPSRERLGDLRRHVSIGLGAGFAKAYPKSWGSAIAATAESDEAFTEQVSAAKGDPESPLTAAEMIAKARMLIAHGGHGSPDRIIEAVLAAARDSPLPNLLSEIDALAAHSAAV